MLRILLRSFRTLWQSLQIIFHQLVGLFFALLGVSAALAAWKEYRQLTAEVLSTQIRFYGTAAFAVLLLAFAAASFIRAGMVRKNQSLK
ncbi:MAG: hypothetical protein PHX83_06245 [Acidobacteriia bacterium]|nr:hypothetical protein [Terriglobia bacterium]